MASDRSNQATQGSQRSSPHGRPAEDPSMSRSRTDGYQQDRVEPVNVTLAGRASLSGAVAGPLRDHTTLMKSVDRTLASGYTNGSVAPANIPRAGDSRGPSSTRTADLVRGAGTRF